MIKLSTALLSLLILNQAFAAEVIVRLKKADVRNIPAGFSQMEPLIPELGIYLLKDNSRSELTTKSLMNVRSHSNIKSAMANQKMVLRSIEPNDADYSKLWNMQKIEAPAAWGAHGTGGTNSNKDDVVVAVVDGGVDVAHQDLAANIWVNTKEIPGNGIDDDKNGYIDDINGWDAFSNSGKVPAHDHGTHVAGIVGAEGNNGKFVAGVNWNVKIMAIAASSGSTAIVLRGYGYALAQKKLWLETNGASGANVVATNSSFGVDRADCTKGDYVMWNDIYEEMGKAGILSAIATANSAWDIDVVGDLPTGCASDYIVSVTNTNSSDALYRSAGWGLKTIDLGAPGTEIYSTIPNNRAGNKTGTSMATPHVAGAIGYLASVASSNFTNMSKQDPGKAALELKKILMNTVDPLESLAGKTVTGGRMNLKKAADSISQF